MRKNLLYSLLGLYLVTMLIPVWWPFNFHLPRRPKSYFESFEPLEIRYRSRLEKDVLKLAMFIPIGIALIVMAPPRRSKQMIVLHAVLQGGALSVFIQAGRYFLPGNTPNLTDVFMNTAGTLLGASVVCFSYLSRRMLAGLMVACVATFVVAATWPDHFSLRAASMAALSERVEWSPFSEEFSFGVLRERALNGLMMMPLGLLAATYALRDRPARRALIYTILLGLGSSFSVEFLQCFLPNRTPSFSDISLNTLGTLAGGIVAVYLEHWGITRVTDFTRRADRASSARSSE